jgi:hypothetical protein
MQSFLAEKGIVSIRYRCNVCPNGCELKDNQAETVICVKPVIHNHTCHRFPSLMTAWKEIA